MFIGMGIELLFTTFLKCLDSSECHFTEGDGVFGEEEQARFAAPFNGVGSIPTPDWKVRQLIPLNPPEGADPNLAEPWALLLKYSFLCSSRTTSVSIITTLSPLLHYRYKLKSSKFVFLRNPDRSTIFCQLKLYKLWKRTTRVLYAGKWTLSFKSFP